MNHQSELDTSTWPRSSRGKLICPDCGGTGWPVSQRTPSWLDKHHHHTDCPDCGQTCSARGLQTHRRKHRVRSNADRFALWLAEQS